MPESLTSSFEDIPLFPMEDPVSPLEGMPDLPEDARRATPPEMRELYDSVQAEIDNLRRNTLPPSDPQSNWEFTSQQIPNWNWFLPGQPGEPTQLPGHPGQQGERVGFPGHPSPEDVDMDLPGHPGHPGHQSDQMEISGEHEDRMNVEFMDADAMTWSAFHRWHTEQHGLGRGVPSGFEPVRVRRRPDLRIWIPPLNSPTLSARQESPESGEIIEDCSSVASSSVPSIPSATSIITQLSVRTPNEDEIQQNEDWMNSDEMTPAFRAHFDRLWRVPTRPEMQFVIEHPVQAHLGFDAGLTYVVDFVNGMERLRVFRRAREERQRWEQLNPHIDFSDDEDEDTPQYPMRPAPMSPYALRDRLVEQAINSDVDGDQFMGRHELVRERRRRRYWDHVTRAIARYDAEEAEEQLAEEWDVPELIPDRDGSDYSNELERQLSEEIDETHENISDEELIRYFHQTENMDLRGVIFRLVGEDVDEDAQDVGEDPLVRPESENGEL